MTRRSRRFLLPALLLLPAIGLFVGGWAVTTVEELPDYVVARRPVSLTFTVRQHGKTPLSGLTAGIDAKAGTLETTAPATPGRAAGQYTATLTLPEPGEWTITIHNGFRGGEVRLLPVQAIEAGTRPPTSLSESERGRRLFVAKGCVTCHVYGGVEGSGVVAVGPELRAGSYPADYLRQVLTDPGTAASLRGGMGKMPNLNLKQPEVAALTAFLGAAGQPVRSLR